MPLRREWNLPIFDGRVRSPLMVNHYLGVGAVKEESRASEGSSLMAPSSRVDSSPGGVAGAEFWPQKPWVSNPLKTTGQNSDFS